LPIQTKSTPALAPSAAQASPHYYNVKSEIRIEGLVQDIRFEPRYEGTAPFLILALEERTTKRLFHVEISPAWFFERDVHKGEPMKIVGSLVASEGLPSLLIAREVQVPGETINVRDARGFPNWRGGPMQRGKRKRGG
jgi:hypothetical protein